MPTNKAMQIKVVSGDVIFTAPNVNKSWVNNDLGKVIYDVATLLKKSRSAPSSSAEDIFKARRQIGEYIPEEHYYFFLHMLDIFGLEEHGGCTPGWLPYEEEAELLYGQLHALFKS